MRKTLLSVLFILSTFLLSFGFAAACPFCSENLGRENGGFPGGLAIGIVVTIFFMLGAIGSVVGFVAYLMIKEGKKSDRRHELAAQAAQSSSPTLHP